MSGLFCAQDLIKDIKETITDDNLNSNSTENSTNSNINSGIKLFLGMLLDCLTPDLCRSFILSVLDKLDELVKQTDNKVDDFVVNAVTNKIREWLSEKSSTNSIGSLSENQTKEDEMVYYVNSESKKFKNSEVISPVFGIKRDVIYKKEYNELGETINIKELDMEIKKTEEFLKELKKLKSKLD